MKYLLLISLFLGVIAYAEPFETKVLQMGCHVKDSTCYATLSAKVGPGDCQHNSIRWYNNSGYGKAALSLMKSAYLSGRKVMLTSESCLKEGSKYPALSTVYLEGSKGF